MTTSPSIPSAGLQRQHIWRCSQSDVVRPRLASCGALSQELLSMPLVSSNLCETLSIWPSGLHESLGIEVNKNLSPRVPSSHRLVEKNTGFSKLSKLKARSRPVVRRLYAQYTLSWTILQDWNISVSCKRSWLLWPNKAKPCNKAISLENWGALRQILSLAEQISWQKT